ncbi:MAG TPA: hypothetical protein VHR86_07260 [Armatimonadota bacterium]|nr:hypothetical protein [Armatimonadota bacterium]
MRDKACALCDDLEQLAMTVMSIINNAGGFDHDNQLKQIQAEVMRLASSGASIPDKMLERLHTLQAQTQQEHEARAALTLLQARFDKLNEILGLKYSSGRKSRRSDPDTNTGSLFG